RPGAPVGHGRLDRAGLPAGLLVQQPGLAGRAARPGPPLAATQRAGRRLPPGGLPGAEPGRVHAELAADAGGAPAGVGAGAAEGTGPAAPALLRRVRPGQPGGVRGPGIQLAGDAAAAGAAGGDAGLAAADADAVAEHGDPDAGVAAAAGA